MPNQGQYSDVVLVTCAAVPAIVCCRALRLQCPTYMDVETLICSCVGTSIELTDIGINQLTHQCIDVLTDTLLFGLRDLNKK